MNGPRWLKWAALGHSNEQFKRLKLDGLQKRTVLKFKNGRIRTFKFDGPLTQQKIEVISIRPGKKSVMSDFLDLSIPKLPKIRT